MTNTWNIIKLTCKSIDSMSNVVYLIHWECVKSDDNVSVSERGLCEIGPVDINSFTPYTQLTKPQVVGWVQTELSEDFISQMNTRLAKRLDAKANSVTLDPPFTN